jgi:hypothetical protein
MSRKALLLASSLAMALLLTLVSLLTMAWATPGRNPAAVSLATPGANNVVQGHALTDEDPVQSVQNARILAKKILEEDILAETLTDGSGAYTLTLSSSVNACRVYAETTGTTTPANAVAPSGWQAVYFSALDRTKTVTFTFTLANAQIVGRVLISGTSDPPPSPVTVTARSRAVVNPVQVSQQINPSDGAFTLTVPPDTYDVFAVPQDPCYRPKALALGINVTGTYDLGNQYLSAIGNAATLGGHVRTPSGPAAPGVDVLAIQLDLTDFTSFVPLPPDTTDSDGKFSFCVLEGTWWVGVALGRTNDYMPYRLDWQTTVSVSATQVVTDIELLVEPATALISATLVAEQSGQPATDACGVVAAFKAGDPTVYNARPFFGGTFELPVVTGTFRLAVIPDPGLDIPSPLYPEECKASAGKYLVKTVPSVPVEQPATTTITIPLRVSDATIHGRLWDATEQMTVTGVSGQVLGWSHGSWSATRVHTETGVADLRASSGDWLLAYHVDPQSGYRELPGVVPARVPTGTADLTVNLPLLESAGLVTGTVLTPSGAPVTAPVAVVAIGLSPSISRDGVTVRPRGDATTTRLNGHFTLTLRYGIYLVTAFGPPELLAEHEWISPEPQIVTLTPAQPSQEQDLQFRLGEATVHGQVGLASTSLQAADAGEQFQPPALVWAAAAGGHTKTWFDMTGEGEYRLPVLQGKRWTVGAVYEMGSSLWMTQTVISVTEGITDIPLDLTLTQAFSMATRLVQSIDSGLPFYGELENGVSLHIPVGALPQGRMTLYLQGSIVSALARSDFAQALLQGMSGLGQNRALADTSALASELPSQGTTLLSPAYQVTAIDELGHTPGADELGAPLVLNIPYDEDLLEEYGISEDDIEAVYFGEDSAGWGVVEGYIVDQDDDQVVIFADQLGSYALIATTTYHQVYLPLVIR